MMEIQEIEEILQQKQNPHRYRHTIGVRYTSICLAMRYGEDLTKASYAGLLHDCAKHMSGEKLLEKCRSHHLPVSDMEAKNPFLLHGRVGAWLAGHRYGVEDPEILSAIEWHTTGKPDMTLLEKIVFTADYIEPGRDQALPESGPAPHALQKNASASWEDVLWFPPAFPPFPENARLRRQMFPCVPRFSAWGVRERVVSLYARHSL